MIENNTIQKGTFFFTLKLNDLGFWFALHSSQLHSHQVSSYADKSSTQITGDCGILGGFQYNTIYTS